ncbi:MAG: DUF1926 domain-containing protein [Nitrospinae bacterium]|nr:DUF1926 domain-containing protein [Nitrospinota bacterium]
MKKRVFMFGIHNHQPVGNFDHIFKETFNNGYLPFINILERYPEIRISLHYSGPLMEWIEKEDVGYFDKIRRMVERGQVEILSGGFYEPLLSILPEEDSIGQIRMMTGFIRERFNYDPKGIWLAERVWTPDLSRIINLSGMKYTVLDDTHFFYAGLNHKDMFGYYITEKEGYPIAIFPIDKFLRYSIPFKHPQETIEYIKKSVADYNFDGITYADDGEKFGIWPGTYKWVYEEGWLEDFFRTIKENLYWIEMLTFSEYLEKYPPSGRIYLPMASYEEMMEWALPAHVGVRYEEALKELENKGMRERLKPFIRGGLWDNFLSKYPESNQMHKKMLYVSKKARNLPNLFPRVTNNEDRTEYYKPDPLLVELYKGQCNCAYWHGLFGGIYLNHLRHAVYKHLIKAENLIDKRYCKDKDWIMMEKIDIDADNHNEILISGGEINAYIDPDYGGSFFEIDYRPKCFNLSNTLTRREEPYHRKIKLPNGDTHTNETISQPPSIHDIIKKKEKGMEDMLSYDWYLRRSFLDHFLGEGTTLQDFMICSYPEKGDFIRNRYEIVEDETIKGDGREIRVILRRLGQIHENGVYREIEVSKGFSFPQKGAIINSIYRIKNRSPEELQLWFGVEFNLTLLSGDDSQRYYFIPGIELKEERLNKSGEAIELKEFGMKDEYNKFQISLSFEEPTAIWYFPVETLSQSESGFQRTYQGSVILSHWKIGLKREGMKEISIKLEIKEI